MRPTTAYLCACRKQTPAEDQGSAQARKSVESGHRGIVWIHDFYVLPGRTRMQSSNRRQTRHPMFLVVTEATFAERTTTLGSNVKLRPELFLKQVALASLLAALLGKILSL